jgi:molecular chaperone GrpE (heat shock protein)
MVQVSDLKANVNTQIRTSLDILDIAKDLNAIRRRFEEEGRGADAEAIKQAIMRMIDQSDRLAEAARSGGRTVADARRDAW